MRFNTTYLKALAGGLTSNPGQIRTIEKLVIFESDDWGAIRTPSKAFLDAARSAGLEVDKSRFRVDALASADDLESLFAVLSAHRDRQGNPACFTANSIMANPDFDKIAAADYQAYFYEPFHATFQRYPEHANNLARWREGMAAGVFHPQFHGREHLNHQRWLHDIRRGMPGVKFSFDWGATWSGQGDYSYMGAFDWDRPSDVDQHAVAVREGLAIFKATFGFAPKSFIAPCYVWDSKLEETLAAEGIEILQGMTAQLQPKGEFGDYERIQHHFGKRNARGLRYNVRNCVFEPAAAPHQDWVDKVMARTQAAFLLGKPAVISTHRINFIGFIEEENRTHGLRELDRLLKALLRKWPDLRFVTTDGLGEELKASGL